MTHLDLSVQMTDLPTLFSDAEFEQLLDQRHQVERRRARAQWDTASDDPAQEPSDGKSESTIEQRFPHVARALVAMWPSAACRLYLHNLIISKRDARQGFPRPVVEDLLLLAQINDQLVRRLGLDRDGDGNANQ